MAALEPDQPREDGKPQEDQGQENQGPETRSSTSLSPASKALEVADRHYEKEMRAMGHEESDDGSDDSIGPGSKSAERAGERASVQEAVSKPGKQEAGQTPKARPRGFVQDRSGKSRRHRASMLLRDYDSIGSSGESRASSSESWRHGPFVRCGGSPRGEDGVLTSEAADAAVRLLEAVDSAGREAAPTPALRVSNSDVDRMSVTGLKGLARELGIATTGLKAQLQARIKDKLTSDRAAAGSKVSDCSPAPTDARNAPVPSPRRVSQRRRSSSGRVSSVEKTLGPRAPPHDGAARDGDDSRASTHKVNGQVDGSGAGVAPTDEARVLDVSAPISGLPMIPSTGAVAATSVASPQKPPPGDPPELPHVPEESLGAGVDDSSIVKAVGGSQASATEEAPLQAHGAALVGVGDVTGTGEDTARNHRREVMEDDCVTGADGRVKGSAVEDSSVASATVDGAKAGSLAETVDFVDGEAGTVFLGGEASLAVGMGAGAEADEDRGLGARDIGEPAFFAISERGGITQGELEVKDVEKETETGVTEEMSRRSSPMGHEEATEAAEEPAVTTPSAAVRAVRWSPESSSNGCGGRSKLARAQADGRDKGAEVNGTWDTRDVPSTADLRARFQALKDMCAPYVTGLEEIPLLPETLSFKSKARAMVASLDRPRVKGDGARIRAGAPGRAGGRESSRGGVGRGGGQGIVAPSFAGARNGAQSLGNPASAACVAVPDAHARSRSSGLGSVRGTPAVKVAGRSLGTLGGGGDGGAGMVTSAMTAASYMKPESAAPRSTSRSMSATRSSLARSRNKSTGGAESRSSSLQPRRRLTSSRSSVSPGEGGDAGERSRLSRLSVSSTLSAPAGPSSGPAPRIGAASATSAFPSTSKPRSGRGEGGFARPTASSALHLRATTPRVGASGSSAGSGGSTNRPASSSAVSRPTPAAGSKSRSFAAGSRIGSVTGSGRTGSSASGVAGGSRALGAGSVGARNGPVSGIPTRFGAKAPAAGKDAPSEARSSKRNPLAEAVSPMRPVRAAGARVRSSTSPVPSRRAGETVAGAGGGGFKRPAPLSRKGLDVGRKAVAATGSVTPASTLPDVQDTEDELLTPDRASTLRAKGNLSSNPNARKDSRASRTPPAPKSPAPGSASASASRDLGKSVEGQAGTGVSSPRPRSPPSARRADRTSGRRREALRIFGIETKSPPPEPEELVGGYNASLLKVGDSVVSSPV